MFKLYCWNVLQALDRLANTIFAGTDKEYISSRVLRYKDESRIAGFCYVILNTIEKGHCEKALADCQVGFDPEDAVWK